MITFAQLCFLALIVCTVGPVVWITMTLLAHYTARLILRQHKSSPSAATFSFVGAYARTSRDSDYKIAVELLGHEQDRAAFMADMLGDGSAALHYAEVRDALGQLLVQRAELEANRINERHLGEDDL